MDIEGINLGLTVISIILALYTIVMFFFPKHLESKSFKVLSSSRRSAIQGKWNGNYQQDEPINGVIISGNFSLNLQINKIHKSLIKGKGKIELDNFDYERKFQVRGGFKSERFLHLHYDNEDKNIQQFGSILLELKPKGDTLSGRFLGFGQESEAILTGILSLTKDAP